MPRVEGKERFIRVVSPDEATKENIKQRGKPVLLETVLFPGFSRRGDTASGKVGSLTVSLKLYGCN